MAKKTKGSKIAAAPSTPAPQVVPPKTVEDRERERSILLTLESHYEERFIRACLQIYREENSWSTPFEELITNLVGPYSRTGRAPSAEALREATANYIDNIVTIRQESLRFLKQYPAELVEEAEKEDAA